MHARFNVPDGTLVTQQIYNTQPGTVVVKPEPGATVEVSFTISSAEHVEAGTAIWVPWAFGPVSDLAAGPLEAQVSFLRVGSYGGGATVEVRA